MRNPKALPAAALLVLAACSGPTRPAPSAERASSSPVPPAGPKITQFYASRASMVRGEQNLLCYGVENATSVWLSPPRRELSAAYSRCVEVNPSDTTIYILTAQGEGGPTITRELQVTVKAAVPRAHIIDVTVTSLTARPGEPVSICYRVENAESVRITPAGFRAGPDAKGCAIVRPQQTTTYTVSAHGGGVEDQERVTIKVQ
jgi:hypothetical protein